MSSEQDKQREELDKALFSHLVMMLASSTMQHLGMMVDPASGKSEVHLEAAQATIDMMDMLQAKTRGNLDKEEDKVLQDTVSSLKLNYVEVQKKAQDTGAAAPAEPSSPPAEEPTLASPDAPADDAGIIEPASGSDAESKNPRFHKSYE